MSQSFKGGYKRLSDQQLATIWNYYVAGFSEPEIARHMDFGISSTSIGKIIRREYKWTRDYQWSRSHKGQVPLLSEALESRIPEACQIAASTLKRSDRVYNNTFCYMDPERVKRRDGK